MEKTLGDFLKRKRKELGLTLDDVHKMTDISVSYMSQLENNKRLRISLRFYKKLIKIYKLSIDEIQYCTFVGDESDWTATTEETEEERVARLEREDLEKAFEFVIRDPRFHHGVALSGMPGSAMHRFVVELYEKLTRRPLLKSLEKKEVKEDDEIS